MDASRKVFAYKTGRNPNLKQRKETSVQHPRISGSLRGLACNSFDIQFLPGKSSLESIFTVHQKNLAQPFTQGLFWHPTTILVLGAQNAAEAWHGSKSIRVYQKTTGKVLESSIWSLKPIKLSNCPSLSCYNGTVQASQCLFMFEFRRRWSQTGATTKRNRH